MGRGGTGVICVSSELEISQNINTPHPPFTAGPPVSAAAQTHEDTAFPKHLHFCQAKMHETLNPKVHRFSRED